LAGHIPNGTPVTFSLINGPFGSFNGLTQIHVLTNGGLASIWFNATSAGNQIVRATTDNQYLETNLAVNSIPTSLTKDNASGNKGETVILNVTLKDYLNNPLSNKTIEFWIDNIKIGEKTTNASGIATFNYIITQTPGNHTLKAVFNGDTIYQVCNITGQLYVPQADLYLKITSKKNPKVSELFTVTYKLGNYGPDNATNVTINIPLPEGFEIGKIYGDGNWTYNEANRTITWTIGNVPVGDPYLYVTGRLTKAGSYIFGSFISSETYNLNTEGIIPITINASNAGNAETAANEVKEVNAATVEMQETGAPFTGLILAILAVFGGLLVPKRK
jgi:uncharacterized repeat protein (TIGR01451 family)